MKKKAATTVLFIFIYAFISAQSNFIKGKLITTEGDTLSGYINYKQWIKSPTEVTFKPDFDQPGKNYTIEALKSFIIDSNHEVYETLSFTIENLTRSTTKTVYLNLAKYATRTKDISAKKCFVRRLGAGKVNIYHFVTNDLEEHFLLKHEEKIEALVFHIVRVGNDIANLREYQTQLKGLLVDACKKLPIERTDYTLKDMQKLINLYNSCFAGITVSEVREEGKWEYGISVGASYNKLTYNTLDPFNRKVSLSSEPKITPTGGIFFNYVFGRARGKLALQNEINTYTINHSNRNFYNDLFQYNLQYVALQNLIRYKFYVRQPNLYLMAGLSNGFIVSNKSTIERTNGEKIPSDRDFRNHEQAYIIGFGVGINQLMVEARYLGGNGFAPGAATKTTTQRFELFLKYNFGKK